MKKHIALAIPLTLAASNALAADEITIPKPKFYGQLNVAASSEQGRDYATEVNYAELGAIGMHKVKDHDLKFRYQIGVDYSETDPSDDGIRFKHANFLLLSEKYGSLFFGSGASGIHKHLYSRSDIFHFNNQSRGSKNAAGKVGRSFFMQPDAGTRIVSYGLPKMGNVNVFFGVATLDEDNGDDADGIFLRTIYQSGNLYAAAHIMQITEKQSATAEDDYIRSAATVSYNFTDQFRLTGLVENNKDAFGPEGVDKDYTAYALTAQYTMGRYDFAAQQQIRRWSDDSVVGQADEDQTNFQVTYNFDKFFSAYAEAGVYSENYEDKGDKYGVGLRFKF